MEFFDKEVLVIVDVLFKLDGGLSVFDGNFGCGVIKILVFCMFYCNIKVLVVVFEDQFELDDVFKFGKLDKDCIVVVCF